MTLILLTGCLFVFFGMSTVEAAQIHRVEPGESFYRIAAKYETSPDELKQLNRFLENPERIFVGQVLVVPKPAATPDESLQEAAPASDEASQPGDDESPPTAEQLPITEQPGATDHPPVQEEAPVISPTKPPLTVGQLLRNYRSSFLHKGSSEVKQVALTFDDGPDVRYTPVILDILREHRVPATFFLIGSQIEHHPAVVERILAEGHVIANHSWSHPNFTQLAPPDVRREIQRTETAIFDLTGKRTALFRPPYGKLTEENVQTLVSLGYKQIYWSTDSQDWDAKDPDQLLINILPDIGRGSIVVMHSAGGRNQNLDATVAALPDLIHTLRVQGYRFVTVDELLGIPAYRN